MIYFSLVLAFALGLIVGLIHKGIHIHVDKKEQEPPKQYNQSLAGMLPKEVQQYYKSTNGQNLY